MPSNSGEERIDWMKLLDEFESFEPDEEICGIDAGIFERALVDPPHPFVQAFIDRKLRENVSRVKAIRSLYSFLLHQRYEKRLNLLHFAFRIFDDTTPLPDAIVNRTPFPHEDGVPKFKHFNDPEFKLDPAKNASP